MDSKEVVEVASEESMKLFALKSMLGATAAPEVLTKPPYGQPGKPPPQQAGAKQQQQRAAEVKELHRLAAVAAKELKASPQPRRVGKAAARRPDQADGSLEGEEGGGRGGGEPRVGDYSRCGWMAG